MDAREKREKKRKEKRKEARQRAERIVQRRAIERREWRAERAFHSSDYEEAMKCPMQAFAKQPGDRRMFFMALHSARRLKNEDALFEILNQGWRANILSPQERLEFGELALNRKRYLLAEKILQQLAEEDAKSPPGLPKTRRRRIETLLSLSRQSGRGLPAPKEVQPALPGSPSEIEDIRINEESYFGEWPKTEVPEPALTFTFEGQGLLKAIRENRSSDRETLDLAYRAWRLSFRSSYEQLLCLPTLRDVQSFWYQERRPAKC